MKVRMGSENTEANAKRWMNRRFMWSRPTKRGMPNTRARPSANHAASMRSISRPNISTSSGEATRLKRTNPWRSRKACCSGVMAGPSVKRVVSGSSGIDLDSFQIEPPLPRSRAGNRELPQNGPHQQRVGDVQDHVRDVIAGRLHAPHAPFHPQAVVEHRPVVERLAGEPDSKQAVRCLDQAVVGQEQNIVED